jgi:formate hydrogenlyase subunit 4
MQGIFSILIVLAFSPLFIGLLSKFRSLVEARIGPSVFQPYFDLFKLIKKQSLVPEAATWIFKIFPFLYLAGIILVISLTPILSSVSYFSFNSDLILIFSIILFIAFFSILAACDTGTSFAGMAASREGLLTALLEPSYILLVILFALEFKTMNLFEIVLININEKSFLMHPNLLFAAFPFLIILLAENKRFPVDNPNTHLELTMIHEALFLEYSGLELALIEYASMLKTTWFVSLFFTLFYPYLIDRGSGSYGFLIATLFWIVKLVVFAFVLALFEKSTAKFRIFRLPEFISFSLVLIMVAIYAHYFIRMNI